jgi:hypothetical protein
MLRYCKKLKFFKNEHGIEVDLFKNDYSFVAKLKGINLYKKNTRLFWSFGI